MYYIISTTDTILLRVTLVAALRRHFRTSKEIFQNATEAFQFEIYEVVPKFRWQTLKPFGKNDEGNHVLSLRGGGLN